MIFLLISALVYMGPPQPAQHVILPTMRVQTVSKFYTCKKDQLSCTFNNSLHQHNCSVRLRAGERGAARDTILPCSKVNGTLI